ncbi:MAG TPA: SDR family NAD(P)-dependent oxidoreductase [Polyangia bacterium]|jgi:NADP-dependent 3-hydroxy acid dehydrogenase YdfG
MTESIVLITGATAGFGAACARRFAAAGARLILTGRRADRLAALAAELKVPVHTAAFDVRDRAAVDAFVAALPDAFRDVTILVNNAGLSLGLEPLWEASLEDCETMIDTNCKGLLYVTRALLPGIVARNRGHVINLGSVAATYAYPGGHVYCGTKAFVRQVSLALRADLAGTAVRVTDIEPGLAESEFSIVRFHGDVERAKKVYQGVQPLTPEDIAETVYWVATRPAHVNINTVEIMPVAQAPAGPVVKRR